MQAKSVAATPSPEAPERPAAESLSLVADDGVSLTADLYAPPGDAKAVVLLTPAMGATKRAYRHVASHLSEAAYAVVVLDPRGTGCSGRPPSRAVDFGIREYLHRDWPAAHALIRHRYPSQKLVLLGHSLGGQLNSAYAGLHPRNVDGVVNLCSIWLHFRQLGKLHRQLGGLAFYVLMRLSAEVLGYAPGDKIGWGARFSRQHIRDWSNWGLWGRYRYRGGDVAAALARVSAPTLAISFTDDRLLGPVQACRRFCRAMPNAPLTHWHLEPEELGKRQVGHFGALSGAEPLWQRVDDWITTHVLDDAPAASHSEPAKGANDEPR